MANTPQSRKRARQAETHRQHNASLKSRMRTQMKKVLQATDKQAALELFKKAQKVVDGMVNKKILRTNNAARKVSRMNRHVKSL